MIASRTVKRDAYTAAEACAQRIEALIKDVLTGASEASIALSGGSGPKAMFEILAEAKLPWERAHIFWVDERCVPPTNEASNYRLAMKTLIGPARIPAQNVHRICGELQPAEAAARYIAEIQHFFELRSGDLPRFNVVHLGMGPDAHTASLFRGSPLLDDREGIAAHVYAPQFEQWRVTLLPGVLMAAEHTAVLVTGGDKAEAVRGVFEEPYQPKILPAQLAWKAEWFLDRAAASMLRSG